MQNKVYFIKVILSINGKIKGNPYRTVALNHNESLYNLAELITHSFNFDFDHSFGYYNDFKNPFQSTEGYELFYDIGEESKFLGVEKTKISKAYTEIGKKFLFLFDYGDEWHFVTELIKIENIEQDKNYPGIIESFGDSPEQYHYEDDE